VGERRIASETLLTNRHLVTTNGKGTSFMKSVSHPIPSEMKTSNDGLWADASAVRCDILLWLIICHSSAGGCFYFAIAQQFSWSADFTSKFVASGLLRVFLMKRRNHNRAWLYSHCILEKKIRM
jgi:hypothetical protein